MYDELSESIDVEIEEQDIAGYESKLHFYIWSKQSNNIMEEI